LGNTLRPGCTEITGFEPISTLNPMAVEADGELKRNVVGFYRTTRKNLLHMNPDEMSVSGSQFSQPGFVVMLIEVGTAGPSNAVFLSSDYGQMPGDLAETVFPFDAYQLAVRDQMRGQGTLAETEIRRVTKRRIFRGSSWVPKLAAAAILVAGGIAGYFYFWGGGGHRASTPEAPAPGASASALPPISLSINTRGSELLLSWDRHSPAVLNADFGMLSIREGNAGRNIHLSQQQLQQGSVLYMARTDQVELELNVISGDKTARAATTVILGFHDGVHAISTPAQTLEAAGRRLAGLTGSGYPVASAGHEPPQLPISPGYTTARPVSTLPTLDPVRGIERVNLRPTPRPADSADVPKSARLIGADENSRARPVVLKISRVVIDPGHGGYDEGNRGAGGLFEKDLALDVSRRLGVLIEQRLGAEVIYTRTDDTFIPLEGRIALANEKKADLFLSIHANSSPSDPRMKGSEVYYLNFTRSKEALEVAARENAGSERSVFELRELIQKITVQNKPEESREIAQRIQAALYPLSSQTSLERQNHGAQKAPLTVLIDARMPSVLAELGYLSNRDEEILFHDPEYREKLAEGLFRGISGEDLRRVSKSEPPHNPKGPY
jgi:N-acetylmuramoyl-L-alanine amidase